MRNSFSFKIYGLFMLLGFSILNADFAAYGQASTPGGSVRLTVMAGGNVEFIFNSIKDYKTGVTYTDWTKLGITVRDEPGDNNPPAGDDYTQWQLSFYAQDADGDLNLTGLNPANTIPFNSVQVKATIGAGCATCVPLSATFVDLQVFPGQVLVDGSGGGADQIEDFFVGSTENLTYDQDQINISYRCGVVTSLLGKPADYYSDDIVFTLTMQ